MGHLLYWDVAGFVQISFVQVPILVWQCASFQSGTMRQGDPKLGESTAMR